MTDLLTIYGHHRGTHKRRLRPLALTLAPATAGYGLRGGLRLRLCMLLWLWTCAASLHGAVAPEGAVMPQEPAGIPNQQDGSSQEMMMQMSFQEDNYNTHKLRIQLYDRVATFSSELKSYMVELPLASPSRLEYLEKKIDHISQRFTLWSQSYQLDIADDEDLLGAVADFNLLLDQASKKLQEAQAKFAARDDFENCIRLLDKADSIYPKMVDLAQELSLSSMFADSLAALKQQEGMIAQNINDGYAKAEAATEQDKTLSYRLPEVKNRYVAIKVMSETIQQSEYVPFFDRIKNYLLGFAAVAIILMLVNLISVKIKSYKQLRENAKKLKNTLNQDHEYPQI